MGSSAAPSVGGQLEFPSGGHLVGSYLAADVTLRANSWHTTAGG